MISNYFKIAWRSLSRSKVYSLINIVGLTVGIACCILIVLYVKDELSYDKYHKNYNEIYRVLHAFRNPTGQQEQGPPAPAEYQVWGCAPVAPALLADFPEIKKVVQFTSPVTLLLQHGDKRFQEGNLVFADSTAFDIFSWKVLYGDPKTALKTPNGIVLTKTLSEKYFGKVNPVGQTLKTDEDFPLIVTAVMEDVPSNSHFTFSALISMVTFRTVRAEIFDWWGYVDFYTYFLLPENANIQAMQAKVPDFLKRHNPNQSQNSYTIAFEPLKDAYLRSAAGRQPGATGSLSNVYVFSVVAAFILFIAGINFVNLTTARSMERAKEIGVRKAVGAHPQSLILQYLTEAVLIALLATMMAFALVVLLLPLVRNISDKPLPYADLLSWQMLMIFVLTPFVVGIPAGIYPALVLSRFKPALVLKGKFNDSGKGIQLRKGLVVFQFSLSVALIACTGIVFSQLDHLRSHSLGFRQDQMLIIDYGGDAQVNKNMETVKTVLAENPDVLAIASSRAVPGEFFPNGTTKIASPSGEMQSFDPGLYEIDVDFLKTYEMKMAAGRGYSREFPADLEHAMIINEAAARHWGYNNPRDVIGKPFEQWGRTGTVIGVVKDFNYQSLHKNVEPLALRMAPPESLGRISLRIKAANINKTIAALENTWNRLEPQRPFRYSFLDQAFNEQYQKDKRFGEIFAAFGSLTIFIACLGLFGLATYSTEKRLKEIGIRKVLGASVASIIGLLSSDFIKLVLIAILIATPLGWWGMHRWLDGFAYRVNIHWWIFGLAGLSAVVIALLTVGFLALRAARMNPVRSLKAE
ncbi:ABC transporter permease [Chitinophaga arvensicola]|uniref:Putative ABC transport system permease protein n=1 Tax=Chitinophaga arvensicola TaxID=29529 RepID=A0A1I0S830_9BACT|nr:ABC transporter permease [Chitinophaga arvensicola]SEW52044.1 putative ABC transport system permease protein [Chitinophaga arvensicola]